MNLLVAQSCSTELHQCCTSWRAKRSVLKKIAVSTYDSVEVWANLPGEEVLLVVGEAQGVATARSGQAARTEMARVTGIRLNILEIDEDKTEVLS